MVGWKGAWYYPVNFKTPNTICITIVLASIESINPKYALLEYLLFLNNLIIDQYELLHDKQHVKACHPNFLSQSSFLVTTLLL